jgi:hypothetical protein
MVRHEKCQKITLTCLLNDFNPIRLVDFTFLWASRNNLAVSSDSRSLNNMILSFSFLLGGGFSE